MKQLIKSQALLLVFFQALIAMAGSLYFSEIRHFAPCVLCWYQRVFLYPLVIISAIAYFRNDKKAVWYILPLTAIGFFISLYQNLLYYKVIPEAIAPCSNGVSCTTQYINWLGFISIPLLAFVAWVVILAVTIAYSLLNKTPEE